MQLTKVRGTRDIIPFDPYIQLYEKLRSFLHIRDFIEIHTPHFEYEEVFIKNLGEMSDVVNKEMYYVMNKIATNEDKKVVLRPEFTASVMRAFLENGIQKAPWKVFSLGAAFRYERPQKGRFREFFQCTIECIDAKSIGYDLEFLSMLYTFFHSLLANNFSLEINHIGTLSERKAYKKALYNYCLSKKSSLASELIEKLSEENILRILDHKDVDVQQALVDAPLISLFWQNETEKEWEIITNGLDYLKIPFIHNQKLIRGLDYYNGLIFEFSSSLIGAQSAIGGGGRYDDLATNMGSKEKIYSLGAGIGIDRLLLALEATEKKHSHQPSILFIAIILLSEYNGLGYYYALEFQDQLQKEGLLVKIYFDKESIKSGLKRANAEGAFITCIISVLEIENKSITIKEMSLHGQQFIISQKQAIAYCVERYQSLKTANNIYTKLL